MTSRLLWPARHALFAAALTALTSLAAHAQGDGEASRNDTTAWGLGLAVMPENKPYRRFDNKTEVWPLVTFENRWVRAFGPGLEFKLGRSGPVNFGLTLGYAGDGYKPTDSPALLGMDRRRASVWLGGRVGLRTDWALLSAELSADTLSHSHGRKLRLGAERRIALGEFGLTPRITATWLDDQYVNYYYGVRAAEATANRAAYTPGSAVNTEVGLRVDYSLAPQQTLFMDLGVTGLGSAIRLSPLVDRSTLPALRLGYLYRF